jgi:phosphoribosylaminoimidazolecarboxamide formyltransferase/IMP cyclohydrolase
VAQARQLHGKTLSFCNLYDANGALELVKEIDADQNAAAAVIKHANPCGFAVSDQMAEALEAAYQGDPLAAFGGIVACNRVIDLATAEKIVGVESFLEVIVAPGFDAAATALLQHRWKNTRLLDVGPLPAPTARDARELDFKRITGGLLVQQRDLAPFEPRTWQHAAGPPPDDRTLAEAAVAMIVVKHIKSNAVCLVANRALVGAGAGQMDRLASCRIAIKKADARARGAVAGSDAFFPFRDGPDELIKAGVRAIAQPGGSKRDDETIAACNEANVTMLFTGRRLFRH